MSDFDPDAYLKAKLAPAAFDPDAYLAAKRGASADSPLAKALAEQPGDVVTVQTPTGPARFTREGQRLPDAESITQDADRIQAKNKEEALGNVVTYFGSGGPTATMRGMNSVLSPEFGPNARRPGESVLEKYARVRDETKRTMRQASEAGPHMEGDLPLLGHVRVNPIALAGEATPALLAGNPTTLLGRLGVGGFLGAQGAAESSEADLTKGEVGSLLKDTGTGALLGLGTSGLAEAALTPLQKLAKFAASKVGNVVAGQSARDVEQVAKEVRHLEAVARAETQKGSRYTENILRHANGLEAAPTGPISAEQLQSAAATREPWFQDLADRVAANTRKRAPAQAAVIDAADAEAASAAANAAQDASNRTRDYFKQSTWGSQIKPRLTTLGENAALGGLAGVATGGAAGLFHGGLDGLADGVISGIGGSALSGGSGLKTLAKNAIKSPLVQTSALNALIESSLGAGAKLGTGARVASSIEGNNQSAAMRALVMALRGRSAGDEQQPE